MINLIKNELEKIFTKKSLYIILLILFVIIFGTYINERNENVRSELELEIQNVSPKLKRILDMSGIDKIIDVKEVSNISKIG